MTNPLLQLTAEERKAAAQQTAQQAVHMTRQLARNTFAQCRQIRSLLANPDVDPADVRAALGENAEHVESTLSYIEAVDPALAKTAA